MKRNSIVVIPALNPPKQMLDYVTNIKKNGFHNVVVINDGSLSKYDDLFEKCSDLGCHLLIHKTNKGKGKALKNAFDYILKNKQKFSDCKSVITADSDGQHLVEDIIKIDENLKLDALTLGSRNFDKDNIPPKSRFGNKSTSNIMKMLYKERINDTQTGLRAIPIQMLNLFTSIKGDGFEYETQMLITCLKQNIKIDEIEIQTVYINNNSETHFNPVIDSIKIYSLFISTFFKYIGSSLGTTLLDFLTFSILVFFMKNSGINIFKAIFISTVIARIISSVVNFTINRKIVFQSAQSVKNSAIKYFSLVIIIMCLSGLGVGFINHITHINEKIVKIFVDSTLFIISYYAQKKWVFSENKGE